jgi:formylglycine-generating enzyme required for sulfatase activity
MNGNVASLLLFCATFVVAPSVASAVTMAWSPVGNAGNANDTADGDLFTDGIQNFGAVPYSYQIGTYDVTTGQYAEFLNIKDPSGGNSLSLWNSIISNQTFGGVTFNAGNPVGNKYVPIAGRENHPVNAVTWFSAIRFANWLNNGQGNADTETGAYTLGPLDPLGVPIDSSIITRNAGATVFLPSEDEWYKAAYYNPATSSYFQFATSSNLTPIRTAPSPLPNHVNTDDIVGHPTDVGAYTGTTSPYGAFDMNGNVYQWNETLIAGSSDPFSRGRRGGSFDSAGTTDLKPFIRFRNRPTSRMLDTGFRVATVPEPSSFFLAALGLIGLAAWGWRRKR